MPAEVRAAETPAEEPQQKRRAVASTNELNAQGFSECFKVVRTSMYVSLAPCHFTNPINGIKAQHLDPLIMTYFTKANGVVLSYFNLRIVNKSTDPSQLLAKVSNESGFLFTWISVDLLIWQPQIGDLLEGYVYMQTASHIGLLVHDTFNASIKMRGIPQDWQFIPNQADEYAEEEDPSESKNSKFKSFGYWTDASGAKIEGKLQFTIRSVYSTGKMLSLEGTLLSPELELDAQPVSHARRSSSAMDAPAGKHIVFDDKPVAKHITFDDEPIEEVAETTEPASEAFPSYEQPDPEAPQSSSSEVEDSD